MAFNSRSTTAVTANYSVLISDETLDVTCSSAGITLSLPSINTLSAGLIGKRCYFITKKDSTAYKVTISPFTGETIGGAASLVLASANDYVMIESDLTGSWFIREESEYSVSDTTPSVTLMVGDITMPNDLAVGENLAVTGTVAVTGATNLSSLAVSGATALSGSLTVSTTTRLTGVLTLLEDIDMSAGTTGTYDVILRDAVADALSIRRATTDMIVFDTNTPRIEITPATNIAGALQLSGGAVIVATSIEWTGHSDKRLDFARATPDFGSQEDGFFSVGSYTTAFVVANTTANSFIPIQVNLSSTGNLSVAGGQVAAARLRVDSDTNHQANTALACLQLRTDLAVNVCAVAQLSQSINLSGNVVLNQGECWVAFMQTSGAGNISGSTGELPSVLGARIGGTGTGWGYAGVFQVNSVCTTAGILKLSANDGATVPSFVNFCSANTALIKTGTASGTIVQITVAINGTAYYLNAYPTQN